MKYFVLTIVGAWTAFLTMAQSFQACDKLLIINQFSFASVAIMAVCTGLIGFGYTRLFIALIEAPVPRFRILTYVLVSGIVVFTVFLILSAIDAKTQGSPLLHAYIGVDMYLRAHYKTAISGLDYWNTVLLVATTLWWTLVGMILANLSAPTKNRTWIKRLEVSRSIR